MQIYMPESVHVCEGIIYFIIIIIITIIRVYITPYNVQMYKANVLTSKHDG